MRLSVRLESVFPRADTLRGSQAEREACSRANPRGQGHSGEFLLPFLSLYVSDHCRFTAHHQRQEGRGANQEVALRRVAGQHQCFYVTQPGVLGGVCRVGQIAEVRGRVDFATVQEC